MDEFNHVIDVYILYIFLFIMIHMVDKGIERIDVEGKVRNGPQIQLIPRVKGRDCFFI